MEPSPREANSFFVDKFPVVSLIDSIVVWLIDIVVYLLSFLPDCGMHCRFCHALSVTQYLFILCLVRWRGMVAPRVYLAGRVQVCSYVWIVAALCSSWLETTEPLRTAMSEWIKLDDNTLDVRIICKWVLSAQLPVLFRRVRTPSIHGTTSMIGSLPGLERIQHPNILRDPQVHDGNGKDLPFVPIMNEISSSPAPLPTYCLWSILILFSYRHVS
jgi:hypothetical protein